MRFKLKAYLTIFDEPRVLQVSEIYRVMRVYRVGMCPYLGELFGEFRALDEPRTLQVGDLDTSVTISRRIKLGAYLVKCNGPRALQIGDLNT